MKKDQTIWLSYDLGLKGDYPGLYAFLDAQEARECGEGLAFFKRKTEEDMAESIRLKELMRINGVLVVDDSGYREGALKEVFSDQFSKTKSLSLAGIVIRKMMEDVSLRINFLATFNQPDFEDVCRKRMVEILC